MMTSQKPTAFVSLKPQVNFSAKEKYGIEVPPYKINSTYREDFHAVQAKRPDPIRYEPDYDDILAGPYADPLLPDEYLAQAEDPSRFLKADELFNEITRKYPTLKKKTLPSPVDQSKISKEYTDKGKSVYQLEFCNDAPRKRRSSLGGKKNSLELPEAWLLPMSIQRTAYRDLPALQSQGLLSYEGRAKSYKPPPTNLGFTSEEHEILQTTTGETDYQGIIGNSGRDIMKEAFYGEIPPLPHEYRGQNVEKNNEEKQ